MKNIKRQTLLKIKFFSYGGALFIRTNLAKYIKGFDERYFTLGDDIDLSWRFNYRAIMFYL